MAGPVLNQCIECSADACPCSLLTNNVILCEWANGQKWQMVKKCFRPCDGNSGFSHDLIFVEVSEWDDIVWFIVFSVCKRFGS